MDQPATLDGRYRVISQLARGGMGVVYLVEHQLTGTRHAAKVMLAQYSGEGTWRDRFLRETRAGARLHSEHVVQITDAGTAPELGGMPFLVMELLDGSDLSALLAERGHLSPTEVVSLMTQLAAVLDRAHALGMVHRDLKPSNLFLHRARDGRTILKVLDFGLVTALDALVDETLTHSGMVLGTPHYMAPEQARADRAALGPPTDRWALGVIAFELLSGQRYWGEAPSKAVVSQLVRGSFAPPSELVPGFSAAFDAWFAKSCHRDGEQRFSSAAEQVSALAAALSIHAPSGEMPTTLEMSRGELAGFEPTTPNPTPPNVTPASFTPNRTPPNFTPATTTTPMMSPVTTVTFERKTLVWLALIAALVTGSVVTLVVWLQRDEAAPKKKVQAAATVSSAPMNPSALIANVVTSTAYQPLAKRAVEAHVLEVLSCYNAALDDDPDLRGDLQLFMALGRDGTVNAGDLFCAQRPELIDDEDLCKCVSDKARRWRFPAPPDDESSSVICTFRLDR